MSDLRDLAEALRPQVSALARELAPAVRQAADQDLAPGNFKILAVLYLDGIFMGELRQALKEQA